MFSGYIDYLPMTDRPIIRWPDDARLALFIVPNVEFYEYTPPFNPYKNPYPRLPAHPDVIAYSHRDYGNRVGFWRMLEVFDHYGIRASVSLNVAVLDHFPEITEEMLARNWIFMSHGIYNTRYLYGMDEEQEREHYRDVIETIHQHTGKRVKGMLGPSFTASPNTPRLLAEAGFLYSLDWFVDDQPFPINVPSGKLIGVPYSSEVNDAFLFPGYPFSSFDAQEFVLICQDQFDVLYEEGAENGRVMCIALHPFLISQPHRQRYLDQALNYILGHSGVWLTTADDIADYYVTHYYDAVVQHLRERSFARGDVTREALDAR